MHYDVKEQKAKFEITQSNRPLQTEAIKLALFPMNLQLLWPATDQIQEWLQQQLLDFPLILSDPKKSLRFFLCFFKSCSLWHQELRLQQEHSKLQWLLEKTHMQVYC